MNELEELLNSISETIQTYRSNELTTPTPEHVLRWANQFTVAGQLPFLREFNHVIKNSFITEVNVKKFLAGLVKTKKLTGDDPVIFWSQANILDIQQKGFSQRDMNSLFKSTLHEILGVQVNAKLNNDGDFIYLDDIIFTGGRVSEDLERWIFEDAPEKAKIHIIVIAFHTYASYWLQKKKFKGIIATSGKDISIKFWRLTELENKKWNRDSSDVLWPAFIPDDAAVRAYVESEERFPHEPRTPGGTSQIFSSEEGRQLLEKEFLIAGTKIRGLSQEPKPTMRPLGFSAFGLGFGSMMVTYRNCPNNCPLALWWGSRNPVPGALNWYPLFERKNYSAPENVFRAFNDLTL